MSDWWELSPEELQEVVERVNDAERRNIKALGSQLELSILEYDPGEPTVGPLPRYIPTRKPKIENPPIVFGPPERIRPNKRDKLSRLKRELALIESINETDGPSEQRNDRKQKLIVEIREHRKLKHHNKNKKKKNKQC